MVRSQQIRLARAWVGEGVTGRIGVGVGTAGKGKSSPHTFGEGDPVMALSPCEDSGSKYLPAFLSDFSGFMEHSAGKNTEFTFAV